MGDLVNIIISNRCYINKDLISKLLCQNPPIPQKDILQLIIDLPVEYTKLLPLANIDTIDAALLDESDEHQYLHNCDNASKYIALFNLASPNARYTFIQNSIKHHYLIEFLADPSVSDAVRYDAFYKFIYVRAYKQAYKVAKMLNINVTENDLSLFCCVKMPRLNFLGNEYKIVATWIEVMLRIYILGYKNSKILQEYKFINNYSINDLEIDSNGLTNDILLNADACIQELEIFVTIKFAPGLEEAIIAKARFIDNTERKNDY
jgi:hypothetical protein